MSAPSTPPPGACAQAFAAAADDGATNITEAHVAMFKALTSGRYANFGLFSCFVDGVPAVAIALFSEEPDGHSVLPLFVSITESMAITDHHGRHPGEGAR